MNINQPRITLGISTLWSKKDDAVKLAKSLIGLFDEILIVIQRAPEDSYFEIDGVRYIHSIDSGLSKSRNILIRSSTSHWLWVADDDIEIPHDCVAVVRNCISKFTGIYQLITGRIGCINSNNYFKNYKYRWCKPLLFAQVSSVEMVLDREWCLNNNLVFDQNFGLGTARPVAEEPIFASDLVKSGGKILDLDKIIVLHPCNSATRRAHDSWSDKKVAFVRGEAARRIGGTRGVFVVLSFALFSIKKFSFGSTLSVLHGYSSYKIQKAP